MIKLAEQVEAWNDMSLGQLEQAIDHGNDWCAAQRELIEQHSDTDMDDIRFELLLEEVEYDELYLEVAQGIAAQKYLQQAEDKLNENR